MPTQKSIPERYPVIEHMEARLRTGQRASSAPLVEAARPAGGVSLFWTVAVGVVGGVSVIAVVGAALRVLS